VTETETVTGFTWTRYSSRPPAPGPRNAGPRTPDTGFRDSDRDRDRDGDGDRDRDRIHLVALKQPDPGPRPPDTGFRDSDRDRDRMGSDAMMGLLRAKRAVGVRGPCLRAVSRAERAGRM